MPKERHLEAATTITLATAGGHTVVLDERTDQVEIVHKDGSHITFTASGQIIINANATVELTAAAVNVHAAMASFDGVVTCATLIASGGVVSPSYTPGVGNVW